MLNEVKRNRSLTFYQPTFSGFHDERENALISGMTTPVVGDVTSSVITYTKDVNEAYSQLVESVTRRGLQYAKNTVASRGGYMAENFVADSYNLDAVIKGADVPRASVPEVNTLGSADIQYGDQEASLKFYKDAESSAMRQSDPNYGNQNRIVPSDQVNDAKEILRRRAEKNQQKGRTEAAAIQEKAEGLIDDRIRGEKGVESTPMTKEQNNDLAKAIKTDEEGSGYVDQEQMEKVLKNTGIKDKVKAAIQKSELRGLGIAAAVGVGVGFTIGFAVSLAQAGITPDSIKYALVNGGKAGVTAGLQSAAGYGIGKTIGQIASNGLQGLVAESITEVTENVVKMCNMAAVGTVTILVFSTVSFIKMIHKGESLKTAAIQVGKQTLFSLSLLAVGIAAQGIFGGAAGMIVSVGTGIIFVTYAIMDANHQRQMGERLKVYMIEKCKPNFA